jgi:hypothetical protein
MADLSKDVLLTLAEQKLADARLLCEAGRYGNSYYLAGYAVELALKAVVATRFVSGVLPDPDLVLRGLYIHDLKKLLDKSELKAKFETAMDGNPELAGSWALVQSWSEAARYRDRMENDVNDFLSAIDHPEHGVLSWVKRQL